MPVITNATNRLNEKVLPSPIKDFHHRQGLFGAGSRRQYHCLQWKAFLFDITEKRQNGTTYLERLEYFGTSTSALGYLKLKCLKFIISSILSVKFDVITGSFRRQKVSKTNNICTKTFFAR